MIGWLGCPLPRYLPIFRLVFLFLYLFAGAQRAPDCLPAGPVRRPRKGHQPQGPQAEGNTCCTFSSQAFSRLYPRGFLSCVVVSSVGPGEACYI